METKKAADLKVNAAAATAELSALSSGNWKDPRLTFKGRVLARSLNEEARTRLDRESKRAEAAKRTADRAVQRAKKNEAQMLAKLAKENELKKRAHARARESEERLEAAMKKKAKTEEDAKFLAAYARAQSETERLAVELEDKAAENEGLKEDIQRLVETHPDGPSREAFP